LQPGRDQALHFRHKRDSVYHNRLAPHAHITIHNLLHVIEEPVLIMRQVDPRINPSKEDQKSELRSHIMQNRIALFRKDLVIPFTRKIVFLLHSRHHCPLYITKATETDKPNTMKI
jgi:hypothetical protein